MKKILLIVMFLGIIMGGVFMASETRALSLLDDTLIQEAACTGKCTLNSFISLGINLSNIILGVVGALTLVMFIYGGVVLVLSGGNSEKVTKGKEIILGSVVGLLIVFGSYSIISFVINDVFEAKVNGQNAFTGEAPKDTAKPQKYCGGGNSICVTLGECIRIEGATTLDSAKMCNAATQECCIPKQTGGTSCALAGSGYECVDQAQGTSCLDDFPPNPCYSCKFRVAGCSKDCCGWFSSPPVD
ncbi:MAG TPA: pilin [bacterium]|nr:pilin [bacterium]